MNPWLALPLIAALLLANAFFVGAEFSLISSRRDRLEALTQQGKSRALVVARASRNVSQMLAGAQLGITICSLLLLLVGEPAVAELLAGLLEALGIAWPDYLIHAIAFTIALAGMTLLHVLLGEMVPKNLAIAEPERVALWLVPPLVLWVKITWPFIWLLNTVANLGLRLVRIQPKDELETAYTSQELAALLRESRREGLLEQSEHRRLSKALSSVERTVADVLVPTADLTTLPAHASVGDVERAVSRTGFSRYPVIDNEQVIGYIHVKDVLDQLGDDPATVLPPGKMRRLTRLTIGTHLERAMSSMRAEGSHLATVVDHSGRTVGVVALEDVVEEYVGTVRDGTHVSSTQLPRSP